jgi:CheY-like chemotaxis protein
VIEDNVDAAEMLAEVLGMAGHSVATAQSGPEGIEMAREIEPDVVLCDVGLPGLSGYDVARAFREDAALRDVFLVALTGYASPDDQQHAIDAGFRVHLTKPVGMEQLWAVLASVPGRGG